MNKKYRIPFAFCMAALWIFLIYRYVGIFFETNDDRIISEIFSGAMTGTPEAHAYYVDYILGFLLSSLYRTTAAMPWYGGMLVLFHFLCCFFIADAFFMRCQSKRDLFFALAFTMLLYVSELYVIASIQYTSTAAMLAITGYICFLLYPGRQSRCIIFFLLELLSFLLRSNAMLMIQPMGFLLLSGFYFAGHRLALCHASPVYADDTFFSGPLSGANKRPAKFYPLFQAAAILLIILAVGKGSYFIFYSSPGWKEYKKINDAVTEITDYSAIPDYIEVQSILDKYHVTEKQYNAFLQYAMIEENLSGDCLLEIARVAHAKNLRPGLSQVFGQFISSYVTHEYWNLNLLLSAAWAVLLLYMFYEKIFSLLFPLTGLFLGRSILWLFLLYEGRVPPRVMIPLYLGEIAFLFCLLFLAVIEKRERLLLPVLLVLLLLPLGANTFKNQYLHVSAKNANESIYFTGMQEMISYCNNHPEKCYFIDASALIYYRGSAFETKIYGQRNGVITGCWYSGAPVLYQYEKDYFAGCNTIYLITSSDMEMQSAMVISYLEERLQTSSYQEDSFSVSNGGKYLVYAFPF